MKTKNFQFPISNCRLIRAATKRFFQSAIANRQSAIAPLLLAALLFSTPARAQITLPITGNVIVPTNAITAIYLTIVTNVTNVIVTNLYVTNVWITNLMIAPTGILTPLMGNVIDPALGKRLVKTVTGPLVLALVPLFADTNWTTLYLQNPGRFPVTWPSTNQVDYGGGPPPNPTAAFPSVLFESILGKQIGTQ